jgi:hypothetical protein
MDLAPPHNPLAIAAIVITVLLVFLAIATASHLRRQRTLKLQARYGVEYHRTLDRLGTRAKAEAELAARGKRVEDLVIAPLAYAEATRFGRDWRSLQGRFAHSPRDLLAEADRLVRDVMRRRGYPVGDFEWRAADIAVDHPELVEHYRQAHEIAERARRGAATGDDLRQAVDHYDALFDELLEVEPLRHAA